MSLYPRIPDQLALTTDAILLAFAWWISHHHAPLSFSDPLWQTWMLFLLPPSAVLIRTGWLEQHGHTRSPVELGLTLVVLLLLLGLSLILFVL